MTTWRAGTAAVRKPPKRAKRKPAAGLRIKLSRIPGVTPKRYLKKAFVFQHPPLGEYSITYGAHYNVSQDVNGNEYGRRSGRKLRTLQFDTLLLDYDWKLTVGLGQDMLETRNRLVSLSENLVPFRLLITHSYENRPELLMNAVMPDLSVAEREPKARYPNVTFTEYPLFDNFVERRTKLPVRHTLREKDTLYRLARIYYGAEGAGRDGAANISHLHRLGKWGYGTPLVKHRKFKVGMKILIPPMVYDAIAQDVVFPAGTNRWWAADESWG